MSKPEKSMAKRSFRYPTASCLLWVAAVGLFLFSSTDSASARTLQQPLPASASGSLPSLLLPDGTVCIIEGGKTKRLFRIPQRILKAHNITFHGLFDLDGDGLPEVFLEYWPPLANRDEDNVVLLVYKRVHGKYRRHLRLKAQSWGYDPGAWFLKEEPHPKAVFMTRYGGSSGSGLFYLNTQRKSLDLIGKGIYIEGRPVFEDLDGDGIAEIYLPCRGRDRTSKLGAAILHWNGEGYGVWWPDWESKPYVMYARLTDLDADGRKEIVAILDPSEPRQEEGEFEKRELGVWKIVDGAPVAISKVEIPKARFLEEPYFDWTTAPGSKTGISLTYRRTLGCSYHEGKMVCRDPKELELPAVENQTPP